jgi:hypothetical protein
MPLALAAFLCLLSAPAAASHFGSTDGAFVLDEAPGWATAPTANGAVLSLRRGKASITASPEADDADLALLLAAAASLQGESGKLAPERRTSAGGFTYLLAAVGEDFIAAAAVDRARYSFLLNGMRLGEARTMLDTLARHGEAEPLPPETAPLPEAVFLSGAVRLPAPKGARLARQDAGWVAAISPTWSLGVTDEQPPGVSPLAEPRTLAEAYFTLRAAALAGRSCRAADVVDHPLANGWILLSRPFACPDAAPGMVVFLGAVLRPAGAPLYLAGGYQTPAEFDAMLAWLASAQDASAPTPSQSKSSPRAGAAWTGLAAGLAGLGLFALRRRQRAAL